jgi:hypothetical protein
VRAILASSGNPIRDPWVCPTPFAGGQASRNIGEHRRGILSGSPGQTVHLRQADRAGAWRWSGALGARWSDDGPTVSPAAEQLPVQIMARVHQRTRDFVPTGVLPREHWDHVRDPQGGATRRSTASRQGIPKEHWDGVRPQSVGRCREAREAVGRLVSVVEPEGRVGRCC